MAKDNLVFLTEDNHEAIRKATEQKIETLKEIAGVYGER